MLGTNPPKNTNQPPCPDPQCTFTRPMHPHSARPAGAKDLKREDWGIEHLRWPGLPGAHAQVLLDPSSLSQSADWAPYISTAGPMMDGERGRVATRLCSSLVPFDGSKAVNPDKKTEAVPFMAGRLRGTHAHVTWGKSGTCHRFIVQPERDGMPSSKARTSIHKPKARNGCTPWGFSSLGSRSMLAKATKLSTQEPWLHIPRERPRCTRSSLAAMRNPLAR